MKLLMSEVPLYRHICTPANKHNITPTTQGRRPGDQGKPKWQLVWRNPENPLYCPVIIIMAWMAARGNRVGPLFGELKGGPGGSEMLVGVEERQTKMDGITTQGVFYPLYYTSEGKRVNFESTSVSSHIQKVLSKASEISVALGDPDKESSLHRVIPHGLRATFAQRCARAGMAVVLIIEG
jgi:hypothetical protein